MSFDHIKPTNFFKLILLKEVFGFIMILAFYSCQSHFNTEIEYPLDLGFIQPLAVGNEWHYRDTGLAPDSTVRGVFYVYNIEIKSDTLIREVLWSLLVSLPESDDTVVRQWFANKSSGLWTGYPLEGDSLTWLLLPYPAQPWTNPCQYAEWWVVSNSVMITVPAGTFKCYHYKKCGSEDDYFYSPNVGLVRSNWYSHYGGSNYIYLQRDLINYTVH